MLTDIEQKALALLNEVCAEMGLHKVRRLELDMPGERALLRAIEQHEAFRQEVSDACKKWTEANVNCREPHDLDRFIIPKTDPLVEALVEISGEGGFDNYDHYAHNLRAALAARGLEVRKIGEGE